MPSRIASAPPLIITTRHGPHTPCPLPLTSKFILNYLLALPDSSDRRAIERRYGRSNVLKLVRQYEEEQENRKWMDLSTMACPGCEIRVEKSMGCNHVRTTLFRILGQQGFVMIPLHLFQSLTTSCTVHCTNTNTYL